MSYDFLDYLKSQAIQQAYLICISVPQNHHPKSLATKPYGAQKALYVKPWESFGGMVESHIVHLIAVSFRL